MSGLGGHRKGQSHTKTAEISVAEKTPRTARGPRVAHPRRGLATIGDHDRIRVEQLRNFVCHARRMNRSGAGFQRCIKTAPSPVTDGAEPFAPLGMLVERLPLYRVDRFAEELTAVGHDAEFDIAIAPDFLRLDIDLHHARIGGNYRVPATGKKSDSGTEHEDQVGTAPALGVNPRVDRAEPAKR